MLLVISDALPQLPEYLLIKNFDTPPKACNSYVYFISLAFGPGLI
jgi:hypothetical protein